MLEEYIKKKLRRYLNEVGLGDTKIEIRLEEANDVGIDFIYITLNNRGVSKEFSYRIWSILFGSGYMINAQDIINTFEEEVKMYAMKKFLERKEVEES